MGHFCTGVVVVTALLGDGPVGMTCQSFVSVSLDPPLIAFSPARSSTTWPSIREAGSFCVNILASDQASLCERFAKSGGNKFDGVEWEESWTGSPMIQDCLAHINCTVTSIFEVGDHDIVIGQVKDLKLGRPGQPLLFYRGKFEELS